MKHFSKIMIGFLMAFLMSSVLANGIKQVGMGSYGKPNANAGPYAVIQNCTYDQVFTSLALFAPSGNKSRIPLQPMGSGYDTYTYSFNSDYNVYLNIYRQDQSLAFTGYSYPQHPYAWIHCYAQGCINDTEYSPNCDMTKVRAQNKAK